MIISEVDPETEKAIGDEQIGDSLFDEAFGLRLQARGPELFGKFLEEHNFSDEQASRVMNELRNGLRWEKREYDYLNGHGDTSKVAYLRLASAVFDALSSAQKVEVLVLASQYLNEHVPWSNSELASAASELHEKYKEHGSAFLGQIKPSLLSIPNVKVSKSGYKRSSSRASGLVPSLGFSGAGSSLFEDDKRREWKKSENVTSLSTAFGFLLLPDSDALFQENWAVVIPFVLNVLDDSDPLFRAQGCYLLDFALQRGHQSVLLKSGLIDVFLESVETCLNYLPSLTPPDVSLAILRAAYPLFLALKVLKNTPCLSYTEILEKNILGSISHVQGRDINGGTNSVVSFLLEQADEVIGKHLHGAVLGCFMRLNFTLNQLITSPFVIDTEGGAEVVDRALTVQTRCTETFASMKDPKGRSLFGTYKYDLLGAWVVLLKRVIKFGVGTKDTKKILKQNLKLLFEVIGDELKEDYEAALEVNPDLPKWDEVIGET